MSAKTTIHRLSAWLMILSPATVMGFAAPVQAPLATALGYQLPPVPATV